MSFFEEAKMISDCLMMVIFADVDFVVWPSCIPTKYVLTLLLRNHWLPCGPSLVVFVCLVFVEDSFLQVFSFCSVFVNPLFFQRFSKF